MLTFTIYLISILDTIKNISEIFLFIIGGLVGISMFLLLISTLDEDHFNLEYLKNLSLKAIKKLSITIVILVLVQVFVPNSKTAAAMFLIPELINSNSIIKDSATTEFLKTLTSQWIEDVTKSKQQTPNN